MQNAIILSPADLAAEREAAAKRGAELAADYLIAYVHKAINTATAEILSERQAAKYLGSSVPTLQRYRTAGILPYVKLGGAIKYRRRDLDNVLERNLQNAEGIQ